MNINKYAPNLLDVNKGCFIVVEGVDGSGKTTLCKAFGDKLTELDIPNLVTHEPGGYIPEFKNMIVERGRSEEWSKLTMTHLFVADRALHIEKVIKPALEEGKIVICDRYVFSTIVYQELTQLFVTTDVKTIEEIFCMDLVMNNILVPDIMINLICDPEIAKQRLITKYNNENHCDSRLDLSYLCKRFDQLFLLINFLYCRSFDKTLFLRLSGEMSVEWNTNLLCHQLLNFFQTEIRKQEYV